MREIGHSLQLFIGQVRINLKDSPNAISNIRYTWYNFVPLQIWHAFKKPSNLFFLFISFLQQIPSASPTGPYTTVIPLLIFVFLGIMKNFFELINRKRLDDLENETLVEFWDFTKERWSKCQSKALQIGTVIKVCKNNVFPADVVPIYLENIRCENSDSSTCSSLEINTSSIDGESLSKHKKCLLSGISLKMLSNSQLSIVESRVSLQFPDRPMPSFNLAKLYDISSLEIVFRNSILTSPNVPAVCLVTAVGESCWIRRNIEKSSSLHPKHSITDNFVSKQIIAFIIIIVGVCVVISSFFKNIFAVDNRIRESFLFNVVLFFIMYSVAIPISIYFFLEIIREAQASFITNDVHLWSKKFHRPALVNSSSLNADLGSISFMIFDKTGTLTKNNLKFHSLLAANGEQIYLNEEHLLPERIINNENALLVIFILTCHSLTILQKDAKFSIDGQSADEKAVVVPFMKLITRINYNNFIVKINRVEYSIEIIKTIPFNSNTRKSLHVLKINQVLFLVTKGSDDAILPCCIRAESFRDFQKSISALAADGLRCILYSYKNIADYQIDTLEMITKSNIEGLETITNHGMNLIGATSAQDTLQHGVKETIGFFKIAGINCFMATGDKKETAVNIGVRTGIFRNENYTEIESLFYSSVSQFNSSNEMTANSQILISGQFLSDCEISKEKRDFLIKILSCKNLTSVICYRMSPKNKAFFIKFLQKSASKGKICCAVGDGSNDIGMLQQAQIGIAIYGKEGADAVKASDYALGSFYLLRRLIFYHGQLSKQRTDRFLIASFYKTLFFSLTHFFFQCLSRFQGVAIFDRISFSLFNVLWSSLGVLSAGIFERHLSIKTLMRHPKLYSCSERMNTFMNQFKISILQAIWHSLCVIMLPYAFFSLSSLNSLTVFENHSLFSNIVYTSLILIINLKVLIVDAMSISIINLSSLLLTFSIWVVYLFGLGCMNPVNSLCNFLLLPECFFLVVLIVSAALLFDVMYRIYRSSLPKQ